ncbi:MAG TPA: PTS sugar transporter subunit IIA [Negativicutes bacterium]|nr:PTS sugar transporter subunit IIA [Negativicutes bacterium]
MIRIVVMGHGGYAEGVRQNLGMIAGESEAMCFVDLTREDDLADFENRVKQLLEGFGEDEVLFACDLLGASPFRVAAMLCAANPGRYYTVAGLNTMAFLELCLNGEEGLSVEAMANRAIETTRASVARFPE